MQKAITFFPHVLTVFISAVFLDSLRFKFTNAPETQYIFGKLDAWTASLGASGLFAQTGTFSQYVVGSAELVASICLLVGLLVPMLRGLQVVGAALGLAIMTGAISFHLFTPLGIVVNDDGGALFTAACFVWLSCAVMLFIRRKNACKLLKSLQA